MSFYGTNITELVHCIYLPHWENFLKLHTLFCGHFKTLVNIKNAIYSMALCGFRRYSPSSHSYVAAGVGGTCRSGTAGAPGPHLQTEAFDSISCHHHSDDSSAGACGDSADIR